METTRHPPHQFPHSKCPEAPIFGTAVLEAPWTWPGCPAVVEPARVPLPLQAGPRNGPHTPGPEAGGSVRSALGSRPGLWQGVETQPHRWCLAWPRVQAMWSPRRRARPAGGMGCSLAGSEGSSWGGQTLPVRSGGGGQPGIEQNTPRSHLQACGCQKSWSVWAEPPSAIHRSVCLSVCLCRVVLWPGLKVSAPPWVGCRGSL